MVTNASDKTIRPAIRLSFFFWIAATMAVFVFAGFGLTYWQPMLTGALAPLPAIVHLHGLFFSVWMILLLVQSLLVNTGNVALHRSVGTFGIAIATGVLITGTIITLLFGSFNGPELTNYYDLMYLGFSALAGFGVLFTLAVRRTRKPDEHRRLILFATIPLLPPGINRLYMAPLGLAELPLLATYLTMDAIAAAILIFDWRSSGRVSRASMIGTGVVIATQLLHVPLAGSDAFAAFCRFTTGLVGYR